MAITSFDQLLTAARDKGPKSVAIAGADDPQILEAAQSAEQAGIADCILVGARDSIRGIASEEGLDISRMMIIDEANPKSGARKTMELVRLGHAQVAMKGKIETRGVPEGCAGQGIGAENRQSPDSHRCHRASRL